MKQSPSRSVFAHAIRMLRRNLRSYALLSVTIVLSFSLLLGYLLWTDASLYNKYKELFSRDRSLVNVHSAFLTPQATYHFVEKLSELEGCQTVFYPIYAEGVFRQPYTGSNGIEQIVDQYIQVIAVPKSCPGLYVWNTEYPVTWLDGIPREGIELKKGEMILERSLFEALGLHEQEDPTYVLYMSGSDVNLPLRVVGTVETTPPPEYTEYGYLEWAGINAAVSAEDYAPQNLNELFHTWQINVWSENPAQVTQLADEFGLNAGAVYAEQDEASEKIRTEKQTKAIITAALLLLLGINLYSCFSNALNERKFEIGVKRALGASSRSIVRQFLYESLVVMLVNTLISVCLVFTVFLTYKFIYELQPGEWNDPREWILYISPHSIGMFAVCSITLTLVFSLIFAYKSTQVEIVRYLKAE